MSSTRLGRQLPRKMQGNGNSEDARTPSTVFSEDSKEIKQGVVFRVAVELYMKKKKLDSPIKTTIKAQPECVSPPAETPRVQSFGKDDFLEDCIWTTAPTITIANEKKRQRDDGSTSRAKRRKLTRHSKAAFSGVGVTLTDLPAPSYCRDDLMANYCEEGVINQGGFGTVYYGYRKSDNLPVAIKHILKPNLKFISLFVNGARRILPREVALMLKVKEMGKASKNIVDLLDWCELPNELILILQRPLPCMDLFDYMATDEGIMYERKAKGIIKQLVNGLIGIHSRGVFHRDIKLENILVETGTSDPLIWIIDFGCATLVSDCSNTVQGTAGYTPPEWFLNSIYDPEPTTVWQIGIVMYVLLHLDVPFKSTQSIVHSEPEVDKTLSIACQDVLLRCLNKNPDNRATLLELKLHPWLI